MKHLQHLNIAGSFETAGIVETVKKLPATCTCLQILVVSPRQLLLDNWSGWVRGICVLCVPYSQFVLFHSYVKLLFPFTGSGYWRGIVCIADEQHFKINTVWFLDIVQHLETHNLVIHLNFYSCTLIKLIASQSMEQQMWPVPRYCDASIHCCGDI